MPYPLGVMLQVSLAWSANLHPKILVVTVIPILWLDHFLALQIREFVRTRTHSCINIVSIKKGMDNKILMYIWIVTCVQKMNSYVYYTNLATLLKKTPLVLQTVSGCEL